VGIHLGALDWIETSLGVTLLAAGARVWAHRRRRYIPKPPSADPRTDDPDLAPLPDDLATIRRALRPAVTGDDSGFADIAPIDDDTDDEDDTDTGDRPTRVEPAPDRTDPPPMPALAIPATAYPTSAAWPPAGLGLTGPGADAAACGFLVTSLADRHVDQPEERPRVVIPSGSLATLLGADAVLLGSTPRLTVTGSLDDALAVLDQAILTRTRLAHDNDHDSDGLAGVFGEPVPPLLLIADAVEPRDRRRVAAILTQGEHLDIHGVVLGPWPDGSTVDVGRDGTTRLTSTDTDTATRTEFGDLSRLTVLEPGRAADLLRLAIEADTGERQPSADTGRRPTPPEITDPAEVIDDASDTDAQPSILPAADPVVPTSPASTDPTRTTADEDALGEPTGDPSPDTNAVDEPTHAEPAHTEDGPPPARSTPPVEGPARVHLFGRDVVVDNMPADSTKKPPFRVRARDILAYLILHPGRIPDSTLADEVLSNIRVRVVRERLNTFIWCLRANLAAAAGAQPYIERTSRGGWTELHPETFDVDVWRFRDHLATAEHTTDPTVKIAALRAAIAEYTGPLMGRIEHEWIEPIRHAYLRQLIDARSALADLLAPNSPREAIAVLTEALLLDPYAEALYLQAMRLHAQVGDIEGIRALRRDATRHLGDIDTEPSDDLLTTADQLIGEIKQRRPGGNR
jgi:DNA-binding SARP family transcriptional activator